MRRAQALALAAVLAALGMAGKASAQTVAVLAAESVDPPAGEATEAVVSGLMDRLFDSGLIATSERTRQVERADWRLEPRSLGDAREGSVDYLACVYVAYAPSTLRPGLPRPLGLELRLYRVADGGLAAEASLPPFAGLDETEEGLSRLLRAFGGEAAEALMNALRQGRPGGSGGV